MPGKRISELPTAAALQDSDYFPIARAAGTYKLRGSSLATRDSISSMEELLRYNSVKYAYLTGNTLTLRPSSNNTLYALSGMSDLTVELSNLPDDVFELAYKVNFISLQENSTVNLNITQFVEYPYIGLDGFPYSDVYRVRHQNEVALQSYTKATLEHIFPQLWTLYTVVSSGDRTEASESTGGGTGGGVVVDNSEGSGGSGLDNIYQPPTVDDREQTATEGVYLDIVRIDGTADIALISDASTTMQTIVLSGAYFN